jgi:outer membrane receptor protein involved in Fe transport
MPRGLSCAWRRILGALVSVVLCVSALAVAIPLQAAQGVSVHGVVRDTSGAPIQAAKVVLHANSYSSTTTTDATGSFTFGNVPESSGSLSISANGMTTVEKEWAGSASQIEVVLKPSAVNQQVVVTAARMQTPLGDTPVSVIQLSQQDLQATPALTLDDSLRQVPGFSLFRRVSSRVANPTTMGVSLRGLGASGPSRILVLEDGIPLNDPFGSWVYWDRVPDVSIESVEIAQGGASSLYGSEALGGVIQFLSRPARPAGMTLEASYGNQNSRQLALWAGGHKGPWEASFGGEVFHTDGYILVPPPARGTIDIKAGSQDGTADLTIGRKVGTHGAVFGRGWYFDDSRQNGTPLTDNGIRSGQGALGANLDLGSVGSLTLRFYGVAQSYHQSFSSPGANRDSETLTDQQKVPAQGVGGSGVWSRGLGKRQTLVAGFDEHEEIGRSNETLFSSKKDTSAGGHQRTTGVFGEDLIQIAPRWLLTASARYDDWRNFNASLFTLPFGSETGTNLPYPSRSYNVFNPRMGLAHEFNRHLSWSASVYRAFRAPTLNELYRSFRQGITVTNNNPLLRAERLTGMEAGVHVNTLDRRLEFRGVFFFNEIIDPITNVQLSATPPPPATPTLITDQRQNLGRTDAPGFEIDAITHITSRIQISGGYQYVDAKVSSSPGQTPSLVGLWVPQVPHSVLTFQGRYTNPSLLNFSVEGRMVGKQFDDSPNQFPMGRFFVLDVEASRRLLAGTEIFGAVENLFNERYLIEAVPPPEIGLPIAARIGVRFQFPKR